ncbi:MAG: hypothetical protein AB7O59_04325 [Pirellulales bacterium]
MALALWSTPCWSAAARESVIVEAHSGRTFVGEFDRQSSPAELVLRTGPGDMYLLRRIAWNRVARVRVAGQPFSPNELLARFNAQGWPQDGPEEVVPTAPTPQPPVPQQLPAPSGALDAEAALPLRAVDLASLPPARSLHIEATVARWGSYADNDGVMVRLFPLDCFGNLVPVSGTLEVELIGSRSATFRRGEPFPMLGRWVKRVELADMSPSGAVFCCPYQAWHPEFNVEFGSIGSVHARLSVPGQGVFDDTVSTLWIRPYDATRDRLQMHTQGRFYFPLERTSRGMTGARSGTLPAQ